MARKKKKSRRSMTAQGKRKFSAFLRDVLVGVSSTVLGHIAVKVLGAFIEWLKTL